MIAYALRRTGLGAGSAARPGTRPGAGTALRLGLAGVWLLDAALQYQPFMFTRAFGKALATTAMGNAAVVSDPILWSASQVEQNAVLSNAVFATIQLLLAAGIAWPRTARIGLAASAVWSLAVWWLGEGFGGMLAGMASPLNGAPGAAILYALLAVLLWPSERPAQQAPFTAAGAVGVRAARSLWSACWLILASAALWPGNRAPQALALQILDAGDGEPAWLAALDRHAAVFTATLGLAAPLTLALVLAVIAVAVWLPAPAAKAGLVLAIATAGLIWVLGESFGAILTGQATDPNTGPLLALLALAYWPG
ncbi:hypothetical protein EAS64_03790 [Trebonia kvetii]|uniref:Uncharacterized protein n=1 Tax=Trebonia kvetii TaxID=2480626 RepID=A0A6P2C6B7_9ACTN|nr:hypothetical protein [Trebonia kvetii]TVZ06537.1 hypothetical protein EAS64_03790 [Trebonia kvetii]